MFVFVFVWMVPASGGATSVGGMNVRASVSASPYIKMLGRSMVVLMKRTCGERCVV